MQKIRLGILLVILLGILSFALYELWEGPLPPTRHVKLKPWPDEGELVFPDAVARVYRVGDKEFPYMVQEPEKEAPAILVYMHGAHSEEDQGMGEEYHPDSFKRLRAAVAERGWLYISPRFYEFEGLLADLEKHYGTKPIFLAGMSLGGAQIFDEVSENPERYSGLIALCPALPLLDGRIRKYLRPVRMPVYLVSGEEDGMIAPVSRAVARQLNKQGNDLIFVEVIDGGHGAPPQVLDWGEALDFVVEKSGRIETVRLVGFAE